ncbi:hypothetical protein DVH05_027700 [Phytophthora capsici]|nr:hypothetical protein DVH05_027700 [Phytophthora capsici]
MAQASKDKTSASSGHALQRKKVKPPPHVTGIAIRLTATIKDKDRTASKSNIEARSNDKAKIDTYSRETAGGNGSGKTSTKKSTGGRALGSQGYSEEYTLALLSIMHTILPRDTNEWERVVPMYNEHYATPEEREIRTLESLKSKYRHLLAPLPPSGKTRCPESQDRAIEVQRLIQGKVHKLIVDDSATDDSSIDENMQREDEEEGSAPTDSDESQYDANSCPDEDHSSPLPRPGRPQRQADTRSKRSHQGRPIDASTFQKRPRQNGRSNTIRRGSGTSAWQQHRDEQEYYRNQREMQQFLAVQNASLQEANTALNTKIMSMGTALDSKRLSR